MNYGKCPEEPIRLNSIPASRFFLDNLVTAKGYHILYHRPGSLSPNKEGSIIDQYEIMTSENEYEDLYINIYNDTNEWLPPEGYLFSEKIEHAMDGLSEHELLEINDNNIEIDDKYIYREVGDDDINELNAKPWLEHFLAESYGENLYVEDFPFPIIIEMLIDYGVVDKKETKRNLSFILPRNKSIQKLY